MSVTQVKKNIRDIYSRRIAAVYALSLDYAGIAINYFRSVQPPRPNSQGLFWYNRTGQAAGRVYTEAKRVNQWIGWAMGHGVQYGVYLELANDRKHAAINPIIKKYAGRFIADVRKLYKE